VVCDGKVRSLCQSHIENDGTQGVEKKTFLLSGYVGLAADAAFSAFADRWNHFVLGPN
jgi:hypothetical protein